MLVPYSIGFNGDMNNENLMLTKNVKMHTDHTGYSPKKLNVQHGCTISNNQ